MKRIFQHPEGHGMRRLNCVHLDVAKKMSAGLALAVVCLSVAAVQADGRPRRRVVGPVVVRDVGPHFWRRYFGPATTYGSPYYALAAPRYFYPPPYAGYGSAFAPPVPYYASGNSGPAPWYRTLPAPAFDPYSNPALQESMLENQLRWGPNLAPNITPLRARIRLHPSTPEQQAKSIHAQVQGDVWMKKLKFLNAYERYKYAVGVASDRPEPYFRLGYALAAIGSYDSAVKYIKQGLELDPQWPTRGDRLEAIFGDDNRLAILSLIERVTGWVREDIRDPDRLFLVGVLLHFNGDNRSSQFFEAAYRLAGGGDHLMAFLQPQPETKDNVAGPAQPVPGRYDGGVHPPAPEEPQLPLDAIPGAAVTPPGTHFQNPAQPVQPPGPGARTSGPATSGRPLPPLPSRSTPTPAPRTNGAPPADAAPRDRVPPSPALPLPPLPSPADPNPQSNSQAPASGPALIPSTGNSTTVQTP
jgi:hypothetical protein